MTAGDGGGDRLGVQPVRDVRAVGRREALVVGRGRARGAVEDGRAHRVDPAPRAGEGAKGRGGRRCWRAAAARVAALAAEQTSGGAPVRDGGGDAVGATAPWR